MATLRKKNKEQYTVIPQEITKDKRLSLKDIGLLVSMLALPDDWEFSENGLEAIFKNDGQTSIRTGLKHLEDTGYLKRSRVRGADGKLLGVNWYLSEYPAFEKPHFENPNLEKPSSENQPQSNTKEVNTKEVITKEENNSADALAGTDTESLSIEDEFNLVWELYPRKRGKANALKAYEKARTDKKNPVTMEVVKKGIEAYRKYLIANKTEERFIAHGSTWFNQRGWEDDYKIGGKAVGISGGHHAGHSEEKRIGANYI